MSLLELKFRSCLVCQSLCHRYFCDTCAQQFREALIPRIHRGQKICSSRLHCVADYQGALKKWIAQTKSSPMIQFDSRNRRLIESLLERCLEKLPLKNCQGIVAVPSNRWRCIFECDLSLEIARSLATLCALPVYENLLKVPLLEEALNRQQKFRSRISRLRRRRALKVNPAIPPLRLILVDDVISTGQSLRACLRALEASGHKVSSCLVLANNHHLRA